MMCNRLRKVGRLVNNPEVSQMDLVIKNVTLFDGTVNFHMGLLLWLLR